MHIQKPAETLPNDAGKEIKFNMGNREATVFTKSTAYTKLFDNNRNMYLLQEEVKRAMTDAVIERFNSGISDRYRTASDVSMFDKPEEQQQQDKAMREETEQQMLEREDQRQRA